MPNTAAQPLRSYRHTLTTLALFATTVWAVPALAGDDPVAFFEEYWGTEVDFSDRDALERFYSAEALSELEGFTDGEKAMLKELGAQLDLFKTSTEIAEIDVVDADDEQARIEADLRVTDEDARREMASGLDADIRLSRQDGEWRINEEHFHMRSPVRGGAGDQECADGMVVGDPDAPNHLTITDGDRSWELRFEKASLVAWETRTRLDLARVDTTPWRLVFPEPNLDESEQKVRISVPTPAEPHCFDLPEGMRGPDGDIVGRLVFDEPPAQGQTEYSARIDIPTDQEDFGVRGIIERGLLVEPAPGDAEEGSYYVDDGEKREILGGLVFHRPADDVVRVIGTYPLGSGPGGSVFRAGVGSFDGSPGVYTSTQRRHFDGEFQDVTEITLVHAFSEDRVEMERRRLPADEMPDGEPTLEEAGDLGEAHWYLVRDELITDPELERVSTP
ncbi:hypothetical protein [Thioalkalivibrio sp. ALJ24]|uniref:hypothetical protein n=1 Tax=Thioalkalivibrio sp. ALJ24 TaxID=545276 RepID=UPI00037FA0EE|nr:hypothetical protein [Thioalkalivibrio sp. ALJ24]